MSCRSSAQVPLVRMACRLMFQASLISHHLVGPQLQMQSPLDAHRLDNGIETMYYWPEFLTLEQETRFAQTIENASTWVTLKNRRLQQYGGTPDEKGMLAAKLPPFVRETVDLLTLKWQDARWQRLNHCLVNEYQPGQGILAHEDGPLYTGNFCIVSLLSGLLLRFYQKSDNAFVTSVYLEPRSALIISNAAYTDYLHGIDECVSEELDPSFVCNIDPNAEPKTIERKLRISMTIREVKKTINTNRLFGNRK